MNFKKMLGLLALFSALLWFGSCESQEGSQGDDYTAESTPPEIPMEDFFKNPETFRYRISPDGSYLSWLAPWNGRQNIHVKKIGTEEVSRITADTSRDIRIYNWANEDQILYLQDTGGDENWKLFAANIKDNSAKCLTDFENVVCQILDPLEQDDDHVIIGLNKINPRVSKNSRAACCVSAPLALPSNFTAKKKKIYNFRLWFV